MAHVPHNHTVFFFRTANGAAVTVGRKGHIAPPAVRAVAGRMGGTGQVVIRHFGPALFGKAAPLLALFDEKIG